MTQKEYQEKIAVLEEKIKELRESEKYLLEKQSNYTQVLEDYYIANRNLEMERRANDMHCEKIRELNGIIERYEKMIDRVTYNC